MRDLVTDPLKPGGKLKHSQRSRLPHPSRQLDDTLRIRYQPLRHLSVLYEYSGASEFAEVEAFVTEHHIELGA